jgi:hypothetical protein
MKRYKRDSFKEKIDSNTFINSLAIYGKYSAIEYSIYTADYNPKTDEIISKYELTESGKISIKSDDPEELVKKILVKTGIQLYAYSDYRIEKGFLVTEVYSSKTDSVLYKFGDKNFQYDMSNDKPMIQELYVISFAKIIK